MAANEDKVMKLFSGDQRLETLFDAVMETLYERGKGLPLPSVLGVLDLVRDQIKEDAKE